MKIWLRDSIRAALILLNAFVLGGGSYWLWFDPGPQIVMLDEAWFNASREKTTRFSAGEIAYLSRTACVDRAVQTTQGRRIVSLDGFFSIPLPPGMGDIKPGCLPYVVGVTLPPRLPPGMYQYAVNIQMDINPLRTVTVVNKSPPIEVLP